MYTVKIQFSTEDEKQQKLEENKDKILIEVQYLYEGNFLIFSDIKPIDIQLMEQASNQLTIMEALADLYTALPESAT